MTYLFIILLLILLRWRRWWWRWRRRRRRRRDDVVSTTTTTTTSWWRRDDDVVTTSWRRRRDDDVVTTSWRRRHDDDVMTTYFTSIIQFQRKTLTRKMPFYRAVILSTPPWNLEFCSLFGWFEFEPRLHFTALNMTHLFILLLLILFWWRRWWWRWRRRRRRDDVVTMTSWWRRREDVVTTSSSSPTGSVIRYHRCTVTMAVTAPPAYSRWALLFIIIWRRILRRLFTVSPQNVNEKNSVLTSGYFIPGSLKPWVLFFVWVIWIWASTTFHRA